MIAAARTARRASAAAPVRRISASRRVRCSPQLPLRTYLAAIAIFCNEVKGKSMLAMSRDLGLSYKAAFVLCHKMREAMAAEMRARVVGGEGKVASVDGAYFGGYVKPSNRLENRRDRRLAENQTGKRKVVVVIREHGGDTLPAVFKSEAAAVSFIRKHVAPGTVVNADEASSWDSLHASFEMRRIDHGQAYSLDGACTNWAEEYFSRLRRAEVGHHHHISGPYLLRYAQEAAFREDARRVGNGEQVQRVAHLAMVNKPSVDFSGYWQRHRAA
jgi:molybdenum-dependent DNA-binding transcriptional regulator ModE